MARTKILHYSIWTLQSISKKKSLFFKKIYETIMKRTMAPSHALTDNDG
jgi:hypothetical protein